MSENLYEETMRLLKECPREITYAMIAAEIEVTPAWVGQFASGKITNPTFNNLQKLHDHLLKVCNV